jgi:hypothetical protein
VILLWLLLALADGGCALDCSTVQITAVTTSTDRVGDLAVVAAGRGLGAKGRGLETALWCVRLVLLLA